jgi:hypothetical protein
MVESDKKFTSSKLTSTDVSLSVVFVSLLDLILSAATSCVARTSAVTSDDDEEHTGVDLSTSVRLSVTEGVAWRKDPIAILPGLNEGALALSFDPRATFETSTFFRSGRSSSPFTDSTLRLPSKLL